MLPAVYPVNVVELDAAAAAHPRNVEWESNSAAVQLEMQWQQCIQGILVLIMYGIQNSHSWSIAQYFLL